MAFTPAAQRTVTNNTTWVEILTSPSGGSRVTKTITVYNKDTASATPEITHVVSGVRRTIIKLALATNETLVVDDPIVCAVGDSLEISLGGAVSTTQLDVTVHYAEITA